MEPDRGLTNEQHLSTLNRRLAISGAVAVGITAATHAVGSAQGTPQAAPETDGAIDNSRLMALSENLCGGATLKAENADTLLTLLGNDGSNVTAFEELEAVAEFTDEAMEAVSPEAQQLAANILQYWFLGRYNGEPVEDRAEMFFDLACWQTLPYSTQPSTCKSFGYWAVEIEL